MASPSNSLWTPEDIRQQASQWTLEGDEKLLEFMQSISTNLERRAKATTEGMHRLSLDVDRTKVALGNVTNQLSALQHSQFVENRVYEDDETIANVAEVPVADETDTKNQYDPIKTLSNLLDSSMSVVERCYEKVSIDLEDSDEEDESAKSVVYRPKDPFENRPLPHIIGSKEWMEKWHIGLCDSDEDFSGDEKEDEFSESSESASMSASLPSNAPTISESELSAWGLQQNILGTHHSKGQAGSYGSSEEDLSTATKQSFEDNRYHANSGVHVLPHNVALPTSQSTPANQYYVHQPKQKDRGLFDESTDESTDSELYNVKGPGQRTVPVPIQSSKRVNRISNIFSDEPPPDSDVVDRMDRPAADLFCESDSELPANSQPINTTSVKKEEIIASNIRKKTVNLFDDDDFDSFMAELNKKTLQKATTANKPVRNLFEGSSGEEEFTVNEEPTVKPKNQTLVNTRAVEKPLPDKLISDMSTESLSSHRISPVNSKDVLTSKKVLVSDEFNPMEKSEEDKTVQKRGNKTLSSNQKDSLFEGADNEADFPDTARPSKPFQRTTITNLFDDEPPDDDFDSLFQPRKNNESKFETNQSGNPKIDKVSLFDDFDDDDISEIKAPEAASYKENTQRPPVVEEKKIEKLESLFEDDIITSSTQPKTPSKGESLRLFEDQSDDDSTDLFHGGATVSLSKNEEEEQPNPSKYEDIEPTQPNETIGKHEVAENMAGTEIGAEQNIVEDDSEKEPLRNKNLEEEVETWIAANDLRRQDSDTIQSFIKEENSSLPPVDDVIQSQQKLEQTETVDLSRTENINPVENLEKSAGSLSGATIQSKIFSSNLFSDIPPEDDDLFTSMPKGNNDEFSEEKYEDNEISRDGPSKESVTSKTEKISDENTSKTIESMNSALKYSNIGLFHDTPPDDDFNATPQGGKKLHSIFYDDFSETIIPSQMQSQSKPLSSYIFDEPPPDSFQPDKPVSASPVPVEDQSQEESAAPRKQRLDSESKIASIIDRMQTDGPELSQNIPGKVKVKPKKLNSNLNINVAALLPGARRSTVQPSGLEINRNESEFKETDSSKALNDSSAGADIANRTPKMIPTESDPSMLQSLNKSRAKIQIKRRPSTRKARQENYRRSLVENNGENGVKEEKGDESSLPSDQIDSEVRLDSHQPPSMRNIAFVEKEESGRFSFTGESRRESNIESLQTPRSEPSVESNSKAQISAAIFFENEPPDDFLAPTRKFENISAQPPKLFDDDDGDLFAPISKTTGSNLSSDVQQQRGEIFNESTSNRNKSAPLFFDDDAEDDDFFERKFMAADKSKQGLGTLGTLRKKSEVVGSNQVAIANVRQLETTKAKASIFGSDDDDDDDIFGSGAISKTKSKVEPVRSDPAPAKLSQSRLFDDNDDDEDDDLFGGGANIKHKSISQTTMKKTDARKGKTQSSEAATNKDFNDPLADLFNN